QFLAIVIARIANDRVDVVRASLWSVFNQERRPLNAVIHRAAIGSWSVPDEMGVVDFVLDCRQAAGGGIRREDVDPRSDQLHQGRSLSLVETIALESFRGNRLAILTRSEQEILRLGAEDRLLLLLRVELIDELEGEVVLRPEWPHGLAGSCEGIGL